MPLIPLMAASPPQHGYMPATRQVVISKPAASTLSATVTLTSVPTAGNLLVVAVGGDKNIGAPNMPGWTIAYSLPSTSVSQFLAYKVAVGNETTLDVAWTTSTTGGNTIVVTELYTEEGVGTWQVLTQSTSITNETVQSSRSTGTTAVTTFPGLAFAFASVDSTDAMNYLNDTESWTNGFYMFQRNNDSSSARATLTSALKQVPTGSAVESTYSFTPSISGDQLTTSLIVFGRVGNAPAAGTTTWLWSGGVTATTVEVSAKVTAGKSARLKISTTSNLLTSPVYSALTPIYGKFVRTSATGLTAGTTYYYGVEIDGVLDTATVGKFKTAPAAAASFKFAVGSCLNNVDSVAMSHIQARTPDFLVHMGDFHYYDETSRAVGPHRTAIDAIMALPNFKAALQNMATVYRWSDHDSGGAGTNKLSNGLNGSNINFRERVPSYSLTPSQRGVYHTFVYGRARFIAIDERMFSDTWQTAESASKTKLGAVQKQWLKDTISAATEKVIFIVGETTWIGSAGADDNWTAFTTERTELASFFSASGKRIVYMAGDAHSLSADTGTNSPGSVPVIQAAPFYNTAAQKGGGTYTYGPIPATGSSTVQQYGMVEVTDDGVTDPTIVFRGYDSANAEVITMTLTPTPTGHFVTLHGPGGSLVSAQVLGLHAGGGNLTPVPSSSAFLRP